MCRSQACSWAPHSSAFAWYIAYRREQDSPAAPDAAECPTGCRVTRACAQFLSLGPLRSAALCWLTLQRQQLHTHGARGARNETQSATSSGCGRAQDSLPAHPWHHNRLRASLARTLRQPKPPGALCAPKVRCWLPQSRTWGCLAIYLMGTGPPPHLSHQAEPKQCPPRRQPARITKRRSV